MLEKRGFWTFTPEKGWLEVYATLFDFEKGTLAAENAHVHAPGGILTGRLDKDENEDLFSETLYRQNGSTLLVRGTATLKGPWHHRGDFLSSFLVLDSPKDHLFEAATSRILQDCELKGGGDILLKRIFGKWETQGCSNVAYYEVNLLRSAPSQFVVLNQFLGEGTIINEISVFHANKFADSLCYQPVNFSSDTVNIKSLFNNTEALYQRSSVMPCYTLRQVIEEGFTTEELEEGTTLPVTFDFS